MCTAYPSCTWSSVCVANVIVLCIDSAQVSAVHRQRTGEPPAAACSSQLSPWARRLQQPAQSHGCTALADAYVVCHCNSARTHTSFFCLFDICSVGQAPRFASLQYRPCTAFTIVHLGIRVADVIVLVAGPGCGVNRPQQPAWPHRGSARSSQLGLHCIDLACSRLLCGSCGEIRFPYCSI